MSTLYASCNFRFSLLNLWWLKGALPEIAHNVPCRFALTYYQPPSLVMENYAFFIIVTCHKLSPKILVELVFLTRSSELVRK